MPLTKKDIHITKASSVLTPVSFDGAGAKLTWDVDDVAGNCGMRVFYYPKLYMNSQTRTSYVIHNYLIRKIFYKSLLIGMLEKSLRAYGSSSFILTDRESNRHLTPYNWLTVQELVATFPQYFWVSPTFINPTHNSSIFLALFKGKDKAHATALLSKIKKTRIIGVREKEIAKTLSRKINGIYVPKPEKTHEK